MSSPVTWVLEPEVFSERYSAFPQEVRKAGGRVVTWADEWWNTGGWPDLQSDPVVFHGSLGNAAQIAERLSWRPGSFCDVKAFSCSSWYPRAKRWLLHECWVVLPADQLISLPEAALEQIGSPLRFFVRPDSPLKPFSGRVLHRERLSLEALDFGFYFDDATIPVVIAPVREVDREWRYVIVRDTVVAGSAYESEQRASKPDDPRGAPWEYAQTVAEGLTAPQEVYVLDVCEVEGELHLLELNPFSGADLYACDPLRVVEAVSELANELFS